MRAMFGLLCLLAVATPAAAQPQEKGNVAVGYSILHDSELEETLPTGWMFGIGGNLGSMLAVVGEVGGNYKTIDVFGTDVNVRMHTYLGGIRFQNRAQKATGFAQFLVGAASGSVSVLGERVGSTGLAFQPGGGVDIHITPAIGLRIQGDFRMLRDEGETVNEFRIGFGAVFGFGRKM